ncbi:hypothetical protein BDZ94DRAFT_1325066 [Collybia nuda]|uniref:Uncharacterized protein n=1 Tax=Collybia nuda TaxID=64659 RepID=A0A9P5XYV5_9AGAR|nr:hypothetical protein BDZ94DRAFT_1325066 [Collybia nuda]
MYPALQVIDIINDILSKLVEDDEDKKANQKAGTVDKRNTKDLLSAALCCKRLTGPSLDHLWRHMDSILPLLKLLPGAIKSSGSIYITGSIDSQAIPLRVRQYAERILDLTYTIRGDSDFNLPHSSAWIRLSTLAGGLLPRLRSFKILYGPSTVNGIEKSLLLLPAILQCRTLKSISIDLPADLPKYGHALGSTLAIISDFNLDIMDLSLTGSSIDGYTDRLSSIKSLKSVTLKLLSGGLSTDILSSLSCLPNLSEITLDFPDTLTMAFIIGSHLFRSLTKLTLRGSPTLESSLSYIVAPQLQQLNLFCKSSQFSHSITKSRVNLGIYPDLQAMTVSWGTVSWGVNLSNRPIITNLSLNIPRLTDIRNFTLMSLDPNLCVTEEEIAATAAAWPHLTVLRIEHIVKPAHGPGLTSLGYFAKLCPQLSELSITLKEDFPLVNGGDPVSFHRLQRLDLQHTVVADHAHMARYIDGLFPNLLHFSLLSKEDCSLVSAIIFKACQPVRKDQKKRDMEVFALPLCPTSSKPLPKNSRVH